jgi:hypothetical protein
MLCTVGTLPLRWAVRRVHMNSTFSIFLNFDFRQLGLRHFNKRRATFFAFEKHSFQKFFRKNRPSQKLQLCSVQAFIWIETRTFQTCQTFQTNKKVESHKGIGGKRTKGWRLCIGREIGSRFLNENKSRQVLRNLVIYFWITNGSRN